MRLFLLAASIGAVLLGMWVMYQAFETTPAEGAPPAQNAVPIVASPSSLPGVQAVTGLALIAGGVLMFLMVLRRR